MMDRPKSYSYPYTATPPSRYSSTHATSSAFSASANPNEDWTKISDLAERRRIQNRIAQRNYRKKLKRRLEDLERRAGSSSASPEQMPQELPEDVHASSDKRRPSLQSRRFSKTSQRSMTRHGSPEPPLQDDQASLFGQHSPRQLSASPPPTLAFATYPPADTSFYSSFPSQQTYTGSQMGYPGYSYSSNYGYSLPPTLPSMLPSHAQKREAVFPEDDILGPFNMNYASMAGMQVPGTHEYWDSAIHTPPLSDEFSFDESSEASPPHLAFPTTPLSLPRSPAFDLFGVADL